MIPVHPKVKFRARGDLPGLRRVRRPPRWEETPSGVPARSASSGRPSVDSGVPGDQLPGARPLPPPSSIDHVPRSHLGASTMARSWRPERRLAPSGPGFSRDIADENPVDKALRSGGFVDGLLGRHPGCGNAMLPGRCGF